MLKVEWSCILSTGFGAPVEDVVHLAESLLQHLLSSTPKAGGAGAADAAARGKAGTGRKRKTDKDVPSAELVRALPRLARVAVVSIGSNGAPAKTVTSLRLAWLIMPPHNAATRRRRDVVVHGACALHVRLSA